MRVVPCHSEPEGPDGFVVADLESGKWCKSRAVFAAGSHSSSVTISIEYLNFEVRTWLIQQSLGI